MIIVYYCILVYINKIFYITYFWNIFIIYLFYNFCVHKAVIVAQQVKNRMINNCDTQSKRDNSNENENEKESNKRAWTCWIITTSKRPVTTKSHKMVAREKSKAMAKENGARILRRTMGAKVVVGRVSLISSFTVSFQNHLNKIQNKNSLLYCDYQVSVVSG